MPRRVQPRNSRHPLVAGGIAVLIIIIAAYFAFGRGTNFTSSEQLATKANQMGEETFQSQLIEVSLIIRQAGASSVEAPMSEGVDSTAVDIIDQLVGNVGSNINRSNFKTGFVVVWEVTDPKVMRIYEINDPTQLPARAYGRIIGFGDKTGVDAQAIAKALQIAGTDDYEIFLPDGSKLKPLINR